MGTAVVGMLAFFLGASLLYVHRKYLLDAASKEGYRAGLRDAILIARERADVAVETAPRGGLTVGLTRGQMAHDIEMDLRARLTDSWK